ncbi:MAG: GldG family protein [Deltaproteobacteria bacterium]|nr:GldG family protein [Deltaproteobacteria bacterium]
MSTSNRGRKLKSFTTATISTLAIFGVLLLLNLMVASSKARGWDVTEERMHSLSPAAAEVIRSLPEPLTVNAYISGDHPAAYDEFIRSLGILLDQYADASHVEREVEVLENGQNVKKRKRMQLVSWQKIDPDKLPRSKEQLHEDWLKSRAKALGKSLDEVRKLDDAGDASLGKDPSKDVVQRTQADLAAEGIRRRPAYTREGTSISKQDIYLTLQLEFRGQKRALIFEGNPPVPEGLEFQFTKLLKELAFGRKKLGITAGNGEADPRETTVFRQSLDQLFEVSEVKLGQPGEAAKLANLDGLIVAGPRKPLPDDALRAIDGFVMRGKPVLFLVDGMTFEGQTPQDAQMGQDKPYLGQATTHGLDKLLEAYGFKVDANTLIDASHNTTGFVVNGNDGFPAPALFPVLERLANGKAEPLDGMKSMALGFVSSLQNLEGKRAKTEQLIPFARTSGASFSFDQGLMIVAPGMKLDPKAGKAGPFVVGYAARGTFRSAFASPPAGSDAMSVAPAAGEQSPDKTRVAVLGDSDCLSDLNVMMAQQLGSPDLVTGISAVTNVAAWMMEDAALSRIRNKGTVRKLTTVSSGDRTLIKFGNVLGPPFLLIGFGLVAWRLRVRRRRKLKL